MPMQEHNCFDAFSYYSNDFNRMKNLLLKEDDDVLSWAVSNDGNNNGDSSGSAPRKRTKSNHSDPIQDHGNDVNRKTRISFEVHPHLILEGLIWDTMEDSTSVTDDESEDVSEKKGSNTGGSTNKISQGKKCSS